jgi:hemerythrin-like domain-containing protein/nitroimidazol reductase NimA-like FMN-containing flavoprotein (pyridoxamine 5'-phosphate oxidase superfamily)
MDQQLRSFVQSVLERERDLTIATLRPDGYPQANTVSYASDGLAIYFGTGRDSQKVRNLQQCSKASIVVDCPYADWGSIKGLSMGGLAAMLPDGSDDARHAMEALRRKFPEVDELGPPPDPASIVVVKFVPSVISVLDYSKGFGHTDLVRVDAADGPGGQGAPMKSIRIIRDEHRALAAVLHGLLYLMRQSRDKGAAPNFPALSAMLYYIDAFPERFHHPKEDRYLFPLLRSRAPHMADVLDGLEDEHAAGAAKLRELSQAFVRYREGGQAELPAFAETLEAYASFHWSHMRTEETKVLPAAEQFLTAGDWDAVDAAFTGHTDPLLGEDPGAHWSKLFTRIVTLAPPPIGVGPERQDA